MLHKMFGANVTSSFCFFNREISRTTLDCDVIENFIICRSKGLKGFVHIEYTHPITHFTI